MFCDSAVGSTTGVEPVWHLLLVGGLFATGKCAVIGTDIGAGSGVAGFTLKSVIDTTWLLFAVDRVMRIFVGVSFVSTL